MPESFYDTIVILFFTVLPITLISLHIFLSLRKKLIWGFAVPVLWSALGAWMVTASFHNDKLFPSELFIFFLCGDILLIGILALIRYLKVKRKDKDTKHQ